MPVKGDSDITLVFGFPGFGKSSYVEHVISSLGRVVVYDIRGEYNLPCVSGNPSALFLALQRLDNLNFRIAFRPDDFSKGKFASVCKLISNFRGLTFVVEEFSNFSTASWSPPEFGRLVTQSRHYGLKVIVVSQRPQDCDMKVRDCSTEMVCFYLHNQKSLDYIGARMPDAHVIPSLKKLQYLHWRIGEKKSSIRTLPFRRRSV